MRTPKTPNAAKHLTHEQTERIVMLREKGVSYRMIAKAMGIGETTARTHFENFAKGKHKESEQVRLSLDFKKPKNVTIAVERRVIKFLESWVPMHAAINESKGNIMIGYGDVFVTFASGDELKEFVDNLNFVISVFDGKGV